MGNQTGQHGGGKRYQDCPHLTDADQVATGRQQGVSQQEVTDDRADEKSDAVSQTEKTGHQLRVTGDVRRQQLSRRS